jgi:hypothetical protein
MSWLGSGWAYRHPIIVDDPSAASRDVTWAVPRDLATFWEHVDSAGDDIRVCEADGYTPLTYDIASGFSVANKTCTVEVDNATAPRAARNVLWVYWGNASASSAAAPFTPSSAIAATSTAELPAPSDPIFDGLTRSNRPPAVWAANLGETRRIWWDLSGLLGPLSAPSEGQSTGEEVQSLAADAEDGGSGLSSLWTAGSERLVVMPDGRVLAGYLATGGSADGVYTDRLKVWTTSGRLYILTAQRNTYDVQEA